MTYKKVSIFVKSIIILLVSITTFQSCVKDNFQLDNLQGVQWNPNLAAPLVYSSLTIQDMLNQKDTTGLISVGSDNFCTLVYTGNLFTFLASELITIPDQAPGLFNATLSSAQAAALVPVGASVTVPVTQTVSFNPGSTGTSIDSILFKQGDLNISISSDFRNNGQIVITIPAAKKNGVVFSKTISLNYGGTVPIVVNPSYDLTGYSFDLTKGGTTANQFDVNVDVTLIGSGIAPSNNDMVSILESAVNLKFSRIYGDIGQQQLSPNKDTVEISVFSSALANGTFTLVDPKVKVAISNSYGVPIRGTVIQFDGYKPPAAAYAITGNPSPLPIGTPTFAQIGQAVTNNYFLDKSNSNIVSVINNVPNYLIYQISSLTNPLGGTTHSNFVVDSSKFKVDLEVELPLYGTAQNFTLVDTMEFDFFSELESSGDVSTENIDWLLFRLFNSNGFPMDVDLQVYFLDSAYATVDSMFKTQPILKSGIINSSGKVIAPTSNTQDAVFSNSRITTLEKARHLLIYAKANTTTFGGNPLDVKIYSDYKLDVKIGAQVQLIFN